MGISRGWLFLLFALIFWYVKRFYRAFVGRVPEYPNNGESNAQNTKKSNGN